MSGTKPVLRESEHLFFKLGSFESELAEWVPKHVDATLARKLDEWFKAGLKDWDISRDPPYFGFAIPGETSKFFYVWFDAPIGYMASSSSSAAARASISTNSGTPAAGRAVPLHRQGHPVFPRAVLARDAAGAGYRKPTRRCTCTAI